MKADLGAERARRLQAEGARVLAEERAKAAEAEAAVLLGRLQTHLRGLEGSGAAGGSEAEAEAVRHVQEAVKGTVARLQEAVLTGWRWVTALGGAMVLGAILALINTLHLAIDARREEIEVVSLIGGSAAFIRRPFLYTGLYFGAGGGMLAALCIWVFSVWLSQPIDALFGLYEMASPLRGPGVPYSAGLVAVGSSLGWLSAVVALLRYSKLLQIR